VLQGGPGDREAVLLLDQRLEFAFDQIRPATSARLEQIADLGEREPDVAQEQHDPDAPHRGFRVAALTRGPTLWADQTELVVVAQRGDSDPGAGSHLTDRQQVVRHLTSSVLEVVHWAG
jgi:hypothetical protein